MTHRSAAALALATLAACSAAPPPTPGRCTVAATAPGSPTEPGPFLVGYRKFATTYQPPGQLAPRTVTVNVWYPSELGDGVDAEYLGLTKDPRAAVDATPAAPLDACGFPVMAYSHGYAGFAGGGARLLRHFVSHGWVAIGPDHTGNTLIDTVNPTPTALFYERALDVSAALDAVAALGADDPLGGKVATDRVLLAGHSFGSTTAWSIAGARFDTALIRERCVEEGTCTEGELAAFEAGVRDPRVVASMPLAGDLRRSWFGPTGHETVKIPVFAMTGGNDKVGLEAQWDTLVGLDLSWVELAGGCHETFNLGVCETLDPDEGTRLVGAYALAFGRRVVLGDAGAEVVGIVDGTRVISDKVTFRRR
jgi:predicted dienelactone hydrolase